MRSHTDRDHQVTLPIGSRLLVGLAAIKIVGALIILAEHGFSRTLPGSSLHAGFVVLQLFAFSLTGATLLFGHAGDRRTQHLGVALFTIASAFSATYFQQLTQVATLLAPLAHLYPDAFLAYCVARFVQSFPAARSGAGGHAIRVLARLSFIAGGALFLANALQPIFGQILSRHDPNLAYWVIIFIPILVVLGIAFNGDATWSREDRRRVRWFLTSIACGLGPMTLSVLIASLPHIGAPFSAWMLSGWRPWFFNAALALLPVSVAYAVAVEKLLPVRVVARIATQHLLARWSVTAMTVVPLIFVVAHLYIHRASTIADVFSKRSSAFIVVSFVGGCAFMWREPLLRTIDRTFFRDATLATNDLIDASERIRASSGLAEMSEALVAALVGALRPERIEVMIRGVSGGDFVAHSGKAAPISPHAILIEALARTAGPIDASSRVGEALIRWLPETEAAWLARTKTRLLVPIRKGDGALVAFLALGERRSELPYGPGERRWLSHLADACGTTIEVNTSNVAAGQSPAAWQVAVSNADDPATECEACGAIYSPGTPHCPHCRIALGPAPVPLVLVGKFRIEQRLGRGGAGVVYRAMDLTLNRAVAIKTLPVPSPARAQRLHREAQRMAAVMDPRLATIYEVDKWRGRPMLVCELMERGTLADRLIDGPMPEAEAVGIGAVLAEALGALHGKHLLHGDIKPSNVGFTADGHPKLLDFGLAQLLSDDEPLRPIAGTRRYMSPETLSGAPYSPMFDLWSLVVLLHEAITGTLPFRGDGDETTAATLVRTASFFRDALATDPQRRPQTAGELAAILRALAG